jgi:polyribonucleotide nucleotidyltransferase
MTSYAAVDALKKEVVESYTGRTGKSGRWRKGFLAFERKKSSAKIFWAIAAVPDGRKFSEIRPVTCEVGWLPRVHGSSLFHARRNAGDCRRRRSARKWTSSYGRFGKRRNAPTLLCCITISRRIRSARPDASAVPRREIGHGNLARRALQYILPTKAEFPYTLRIVSDITESNGSSRWRRFAAAV